MSDSEHEIDNDDEIFGMHFADQAIDNQRIAVRYLRTDIKASLNRFNLFNVSQKISIRLVDISSKGAAIESKKKLRPKDKVILELHFKDKHHFTIPAKIIHQTNKNKDEYGLKFDKFNNDLGDQVYSN